MYGTKLPTDVQTAPDRTQAASENELWRSLRLRAVYAFAAMLGVPIRARDEFRAIHSDPITDSPAGAS
jgi:hypothetical protein